MLLRRLSVFALLAVGVFAVQPLHAQVKASLLAAETSVQPGRAFTVALRLEHQPHWHTYWIEPGTGLATSLAWILPQGWKAGEIQWPTPLLIKDSSGTVTGNGYDGVAYLPVTITPPADAAAGQSVTLRATAKWLMCADTCVPGKAEVQLTLPVTTGPVQPDAEIAGALAALPMPRAPECWVISAGREGGKVVLRMISQDRTGCEWPAPHFFSADGFIQYDEPQLLRKLAKGFELVLTVSPSAEQATARLVGVLAGGQPYAGIKIDVPYQGVLPPLEAAGAVTSQTGGTAPATSGGMVGTLVLALLGGLILNLMPCVFPVLGLKVLGFVNQAGADRRKVTLHGLLFTAGVVGSFWLLAGVLAALRAGGEQLGWGFQLQSPVFVFVLAVLLLAFALSLSGVFEFGLYATSFGGALQAKSGYSGSFFTGVLATVVATPCSAPFLAPALGAALALPVAHSFLVFTVIALGLSLPYLLLSLFPQAVRLLPKPGAWMETFKQFMAFPLYATIGYLVWVLAGQTDDNGLLYALFGLTLVAMAAWLYGRYTAPGAKAARVRAGVLGGLALLALGAWTGWPKAPSPTDIVWEKWSPEAVTALRSQGRTIYVDFTARWCATCQANKKLVFGSEAVRKVFQEKRVATLKADWTNQDPAITAELARFNRSAVPFNLIYKPGVDAPVVLSELLTPGVVLDALK